MILTTTLDFRRNFSLAICERHSSEDSEIKQMGRTARLPSSTHTFSHHHPSMSLDNLPDEVILDNLLPFLDISSLLSLSQTNLHLARVTGE